VTTPRNEARHRRNSTIPLSNLGKEAKRIAVIAVARKLAIILYALWSTGEVYEPLRNATKPAPDATLDVPASPPPTDHQEPAQPS